MTLPEVVSEAEWRAAREELLVKEKEATRALDALAAERRHDEYAEESDERSEESDKHSEESDEHSGVSR
jgi:predicted dithiol-disulfide oxidoreductase (DUF899 family)